MSKYRIHVDEVLEDGTVKPFFFDAENTIPELIGEGFVIMVKDNETDKALKSACSIHQVSVSNIALMIKDTPHLEEAARVAVMGAIAEKLGSLTRGE